MTILKNLHTFFLGIVLCQSLFAYADGKNEFPSIISNPIVHVDSPFLSGNNEDLTARFEFSLYNGIGTPILDNGVVILFSASPTFRLNNTFAIKADLSYVTGPKLERFLSGVEMSEQTFISSVGFQLRTRTYYDKLYFSYHATIGYYWTEQNISNFGLEVERGVAGTSFANVHYGSFLLGAGVIRNYMGFRLGVTIP